jgi:hypothetical protein
MMTRQPTARPAGGAGSIPSGTGRDLVEILPDVAQVRLDAGDRGSGDAVEGAGELFDCLGEVRHRQLETGEAFREFSVFHRAEFTTCRRPLPVGPGEAEFVPG